LVGVQIILCQHEVTLLTSSSLGWVAIEHRLSNSRVLMNSLICLMADG